MENGGCMHCDLEKPPFLHHVFHNNNYLRLCTACLLNIHPGAFCPVCFEVYETENPNPSSDRVNCHCCPAVSHLSCITAAPSTSLSLSISIEGVPYICPSCSDPNFRFFNLGANEKSVLLIDQHLASQLLAASVISQRTMKKAADLHRRWAEMKAEQALQARKQAKLAIEILEQMTSPFNESSSSVDAQDDSISSSSSQFVGSESSVNAPNDSSSSSSSSQSGESEKARPVEKKAYSI